MADISQIILPGGETPQNIKALKIPYGTCSTAAATAAKTVTIKSDNGSTGNNAPFVLEGGAIIAIKFTVTNTAANPTLNVNETGAKAIYYRGSAIAKEKLAANRTYQFVYNGTQWEFVGDIDTNTNITYTLSSGTEEGTLKLTPNSGSIQDNKKVTGWENVYKKQDDVHLTSIDEYLAIGNEKYWDGKNYYVDDDTPIFPPTAHIYGWQVDPEESDPAAAIIYLEDAVGMTPVSMGTSLFNYGSWSEAFFMPKPCMLKSDGTVDYYLNPNDYSKKVDGTTSDYNNLAYDGNCMLEWPLIWYKYVAGDGEGTGSFYCSDMKVDDTYECWCNYDADNNVIQHFYTAAFNGIIYDNKMRSIAGYPLIDKVSTVYSNTSTYTVGSQIFRNDRQYKCITAITVPEEFNEAKWEQVPFNGNTTGSLETATAIANNMTAKQEWYIDVFADRMLINGLLILISKSLNSQAAFGNGIQGSSQATKNAYVTGALSNKGLFYGSKSSNTVGIKVFGMENWWGLVWHRTAGLIASGTGYKYKLTYGTKDGSTANGYSTGGTGYKTANVTRPANGYLTKATYGDWGDLPSNTINGSASTYYADYYYDGTGFALFGGGAGSAAGSPGCSCLALNHGFSNVVWGIAAALSCKPLA